MVSAAGKNIPVLVSPEVENAGRDTVPAAGSKGSVMFAEPLTELPHKVLAVCHAVAVEALPVRAPTNVVEVTEVKPANVVTVAPRDTAVEPIVTELFVSLALAIEPANIVLVTDPVSPVVTTVPVIAGRVIVFVPAAAVAAKVIVPDVEPFNKIFFPAANAIFSEEVQAPVALTQLNVLSLAPFRVIPPPSAVVFVGEATEPNSIFLSSTESVVELIVVVVPLTVKSPLNVTLAAATVPVNVGDMLSTVEPVPVEVVTPVPPEATANVADSPAAVPVVFWFSVGISAATIALNVGTPAVPLGDANT